MKLGWLYKWSHIRVVVVVGGGGFTLSQRELVESPQLTCLSDLNSAES